MGSYEEFNEVCTVAEHNLLTMNDKDSVVLITQLRSFDRQKKTETHLNILWVPYIVSETVLAETNRFTASGKTFSIAAINDQKVSVEEAVQIFESLHNL